MNFKNIFGAALVGGLALAGTATAESSDIAELKAMLIKQQQQLNELKASNVEATKQYMSLAEKPGAKLELSKHIEGLKIKGDLRFRYEARERSEGKSDRERFRQRFRLGFTFKTSEDWDLAFGLTTGLPTTSRNDTYQDNFGTSEIQLDYAYGRHKFGNSTLTLGQHRAPFKTTGLFFDSDLRPVGASYQWKGEESGMFLNAGFYTLETQKVSGGDEDFGTLSAIQAGYEDDRFTAAAAFHYYNAVASDNLGAPDDNNYNIIEVYADTTLKFGEKDAVTVIPYLQAAYNIGAGDREGGSVLNQEDPTSTEKADDNNLAYSLGLNAKYSNWNFRYAYAHFEADSLHTGIKDGDFGQTAGQNLATDVKGHILRLGYKLSKNCRIEVRHMMTERIEGPSRDADLTQIDLRYKF